MIRRGPCALYKRQRACAHPECSTYQGMIDLGREMQHARGRDELAIDVPRDGWRRS